MTTPVSTHRSGTARITRALIPFALSAAALLAPLTASADCNPACRHGKVCRYDSTHNPQFYCHKPPSAQSATTAPPRNATAPLPGNRASDSPTPRKAAAQYNPKEIGIDKATARPSVDPARK